MAEIINLNKQRKVKMRVEKEKTAVENRVKFGRTKIEKQQENLKKEQLNRFVDSHQRSSEEKK